MANYGTLQAAIDAGISNMTKIFGPRQYDSGYGTIQTGINWFKFNNATLASVYIHGNSFLGFNGQSENFYVNERDCSVWEFYTETGVIGVTKFFKMRWIGHAYWGSAYSPTAADRLEWDLFLLETGQMFLNYYKVPTSYFQNTNGIRADSNVTFSTSSGVAREFTFTPSDVTTGRGWSVSSERPDVSLPYKSSGNAVFEFQNYLSEGGDSLFWNSNTPEGTSARFFSKVDNGTYTEITQNGGAIKGVPSTSCTLFIKVELSTTNTTKTPTVNYLSVRNNSDKKILVLNVGAPNLRPAVGNVTLSYDGLGGLQGQGGPSEAFVGTFTPSGLIWAGNQNNAEHIEMSMSATGTLTQITYVNAQCSEHIEMTMGAVGVLTNIQDI